jgi:ATP-dependent DNA helicase RecG
MPSLNSPITVISGVGDVREKQLLRLDIRTVRDIMYFFPRAYEKRGDIKLLKDTVPGETQSVVLTVTSEVKSTMLKRGLTVSKFRACDESASCEIIYFNSPFIKQVFHIGDEFRFYGKTELNRRTFRMTNPEYDKIVPDKPLPSLVPVYPLTKGLSQAFISKSVRIALSDFMTEIKDTLPESIRLKYSLSTLSYALKNIHFPENEEALKRALARLAFDEMFIFAVGIAGLTETKERSVGIPFSPCSLAPILDMLPYELTNSQKMAVNDIYRDTVTANALEKKRSMARIIVGDVGSGKTVCATLAMYLTAKSGYQAAMMAPTEILARQHYAEINAMFEQLGIKTELLLGATTAKEKSRIYASLKSGETNIVIGTHALISEKTEYKNLGMVITDEQHRFGVAQRAMLKDKASSAHMLVMSATPIPRSLALTMYGDLDVSRITEMPKGRMRVDTFVVDEGYRDRLNTFISKQVENGGQCYVICPAIQREEDDSTLYEARTLTSELMKISNTDIKNVIEYTENLRQNLPNLEIECLHGKMKSKEKDEVMKSFAEGKTKVLVSTTVVEVGVNVPNANLMIIENADRFGLSQLHQLRGRVGRGTRKSYCVLVSDSKSEKAKSRLEVIRTTYDGYEIAEKDLLLRGPGDFFSSLDNGNNLRQSGGFEFKLAKLCDDTLLLDNAFSAAKELLNTDPSLSAPENILLREALADYLTASNSTIS